MGKKKRFTQNFNKKEDHLKELGLNGRIILIWILNK
jgi:hypothetical protein